MSKQHYFDWALAEKAYLHPLNLIQEELTKRNIPFPLNKDNYLAFSKELLDNDKIEIATALLLSTWRVFDDSLNDNETEDLIDDFDAELFKGDPEEHIRQTFIQGMHYGEDAAREGGSLEFLAEMYESIIGRKYGHGSPYGPLTNEQEAILQIACFETGMYLKEEPSTRDRGYYFLAISGKLEDSNLYEEKMAEVSAKFDWCNHSEDRQKYDSFRYNDHRYKITDNDITNDINKKPPSQNKSGIER